MFHVQDQVVEAQPGQELHHVTTRQEEQERAGAHVAALQPELERWLHSIVPLSDPAGPDGLSHTWPVHPSPIAAKNLANSRLVVAVTQHRVGDRRKVSVAHETVDVVGFVGHALAHFRVEPTSDCTPPEAVGGIDEDVRADTDVGRPDQVERVVHLTEVVAQARVPLVRGIPDEGGERRQADNPAPRCAGPHLFVRDVPGILLQLPRVRMREDHRVRRGVDRLEAGALADVTQVDHHANPVHFLDGLHSQTRQRPVGWLQHSRRQQVAFVVGELNDPDAEAMKHADEMDVASQRRAALESQDDAELAFPFRPVEIRTGLDEQGLVRKLLEQPVERHELVDRREGLVAVAADGPIAPADSRRQQLPDDTPGRSRRQQAIDDDGIAIDRWRAAQLRVAGFVQLHRYGLPDTV